MGRLRNTCECISKFKILCPLQKSKLQLLKKILKRKKMSKKGKTKGRSISNVKKSNIKQNKLIKAGKAKPKSNPHFVEGGKYRNKTKQGALTPEQLLKRQEY